MRCEVSPSSQLQGGGEVEDASPRDGDVDRPALLALVGGVRDEDVQRVQALSAVVPLDATQDRTSATRRCGHPYRWMCGVGITPPRMSHGCTPATDRTTQQWLAFNS